VVESLLKCNIQKFDFSSNSIGNDGGLLLSASIKKFKFLKDLNISSNTLERDGTSAVVEALTDLSIQKLDISWNRMGEDGAMRVAEALKKFKFVTRLNVG